MSEEEYYSLVPGSKIKVRSLEDIKHDFHHVDDDGDGYMDIPAGWCDEMDIWCGKELTVSSVPTPENYCHVEENKWSYSLEMLEPLLENNPPQYSEEELIKSWKEMIFGE